MCCCSKPNVNGEQGYSWDGKSLGVRAPMPPSLEENDTLLFDEPGRCGGLDSHCHHYRVVSHIGLSLLVRHGGGEERIRLSTTPSFKEALSAMDSNARYWTLGAIYHAHSDGAGDARTAEALKWRTAAAEKRIKTRKFRGSANDSCRKVWIEAKVAAQ